jgi:hypothetical protein
VTPSQLSRDLAAFVARVERTYRRLVGRGVRPAVRMVPRGPGRVV